MPRTFEDRTQNRFAARREILQKVHIRSATEKSEAATFDPPEYCRSCEHATKSCPRNVGEKILEIAHGFTEDTRPTVEAAKVVVAALHRLENLSELSAACMVRVDQHDGEPLRVAPQYHYDAILPAGGYTDDPYETEFNSIKGR